ncbi:phosphoesterase PA-phosphatase [Mycobacterium sp. JS623]|uniref:phosphoesterase PA-phosphatase n=1 Tax=Mycobacterium sp. JS623 TaxID=212767 RepID=UPI0002F95082|nr:phosphoesterase PA-phosphatase [Mycobacterium sp. JS623]
MDDWFHRHGSHVRFLTFLVSPWILASVVVVTLAVAVYRGRYRLAVATALCPVLAMGLARLLKPLFGRERQSGLAYPSGHTATLVVVMGMVVLAAGAALWVVLIAVTYCMLGMLGVGVSFHYFTDTVGGLLLGVSVVGVAALVLRHAAHRT